MDFLEQSQKIVKCSVCGKEFLGIVEPNGDDIQFCSADCTEKYNK